MTLTYYVTGTEVVPATLPIMPGVNTIITFDFSAVMVAGDSLNTSVFTLSTGLTQISTGTSASQCWVSVSNTLVPGQLATVGVVSTPTPSNNPLAASLRLVAYDLNS